MYPFRRFFLILILVPCVTFAAPSSTTPQANTGSTPKVDAPANGEGSPNIILITLDTTRADRMGFLGSKLGVTPNLDALAQESSVFTHAYAQVPLTTPSHATILSGTYPQFHGLIDFQIPLPADVPYGPEILHVHGYRTAAFVGSMALAPGTLAPGFERGFDTYDADFHPEALGRQFFHKKDRDRTVERSGDEVVTLALEWLNQHPKGPFFLWVHLYDAHAPYEPPEPYASRYASEPYDGGIAYEDAVVGRFIEELKARKFYDGAVIAVMADHGESLGAHGEDTHGVFLYDETIHVPLTVKLPYGTGKRVESRVELVDVMPTLLDAVGIKAPATMQGETLLGLIQTDEAAMGVWRDRPAYAQADYPRLTYEWSALQSWRTGKYLYVQAPHRELYDQTTDTKAEHNLAASSPAVADTLSAKMASFREKTSSHRESTKVAADPAAEQKLAALGYVAPSVHSSTSSDQGPDPKDRVESLHLIEKLPTVLEDGRFADALPIVLELIVKEPNMSQLYLKLAGCYMALKQYEKAIPILRKARDLYPTNIGVEMNLAKALLEARDFEGAATVSKDLVEKVPLRLTAHTFLQRAYFQSKHYPEAIKACEELLVDLPDDYDSNLILGLALAQSGAREAAVPKLQKAAEVHPRAPEPPMALAVVYAMLGRAADAERERTEASRLGATPPSSLDAISLQ
jgi:arylsulfatase A-like enzyme/Flp pilus assembly protein TadD